MDSFCKFVLAMMLSQLRHSPLRPDFFDDPTSKKIRTDPAARGTELLKMVFGR